MLVYLINNFFIVSSMSVENSVPVVFNIMIVLLFVGSWLPFSVFEGFFLLGFYGVLGSHL